MFNKKILILGGSHRDIPLIEASKKLGFFVITLGLKDYYIGHRYSNKYYLIDFNDINLVKNIIKQENISYIIPGCGEESYLNAVKLSQELGIGNFDNYNIAKLLHNKWQFKEFCINNNISVPKGVYYNTQDINLNFPIVIKPTNLSGGKGVDIVYSKQEFNTSIKKALKLSDEIFLEEYIEGKLIAYSVFIKNKKIIYAFSGADETYLNPYLITTAYPIKLNNKVQNKINKDIEKIATTLDIVDGMFHFQIIIKNNIPYIIDITRRIPGDLYPYLIEYCNGVKYSEAVIKSYIGYDITTEFNITRDEFIVRYVVMANKDGIYKGIKIDKSIEKDILFKLELLKDNQNINNFLNTQIAIFLLKIDKSMIDKLNLLLKPVIESE